MSANKHKPRSAKPKRKRRSRRPLATFIIVPKHQMRAKKPAMLVDPTKVVVTQLTQNLEHAKKLTSRSGAFRHVQSHQELKKRFWYRRLPA